MKSVAILSMMLVLTACGMGPSISIPVEQKPIEKTSQDIATGVTVTAKPLHLLISKRERKIDYNGVKFVDLENTILAGKDVTIDNFQVGSNTFDETDSEAINAFLREGKSLNAAVKGVKSESSEVIYTFAANVFTTQGGYGRTSQGYWFPSEGMNLKLKTGESVTITFRVPETEVKLLEQLRIYGLKYSVDETREALTTWP